MANDPVKLFIGTSSNGEDAKIEMAYEHSIRKNCSRPVDITWMRQTTDETSFWYGWADKNWSTPFSGYRWGIPEACNFEGKAIYTDVDMINMRDMAELVDLEVPKGKLCLARDGKRFGGKEFCVIVFDNAKWKKVVPAVETWKEDATAHHQFINMFIANNLVGDLDPRWNSHDGDTDEIYQLHYTHMATQPWQPKWFTGEVQEHPRKDLVEIYEKAYDEAVLEGYKLEDYEVDRGVKYGIIGQ
tara:strand:- start:53 stop:781 length:729 start_codon:yes stop_codon:yes gene_type:complete